MSTYKITSEDLAAAAKWAKEYETEHERYAAALGHLLALLDPEDAYVFWSAVDPVVAKILGPRPTA